MVEGNEYRLKPWAEVFGRWLCKDLMPERIAVISDNGKNMETKLEADGSFSFKRVEPGGISVNAYFQDNAGVYSKNGICKSGKACELKLGEDLQVVEFKILLSEGVPAQTLNFSVSGESGSSQPTAFRNFWYRLQSAGGVIKLPLSKDGGNLNISMCDGLSILFIPLRKGESSKDIDLRENIQLRNAIALANAPRNRSVSGRIAYPDCSPASGVNIQIFEGNGDFERSVAQIVSGSDGAFHLDKLPEVHNLRFGIEAPDEYADENIAFGPKENFKEVVLRKAAFIKGKAEGMSQGKFGLMIEAETPGGFFQTAAIRSDGEYVLKLNNIVKETVVTVRATAGLQGREILRKVKVSPGESHTLDLDLK